MVTPVDNNILPRVQQALGDNTVSKTAGSGAGISTPIDFSKAGSPAMEAHIASENTIKKPGLFKRIAEKLKKLGGKFKETKIGNALANAGNKIGSGFKKVGKAIAKPFKGVGNAVKGGFGKIAKTLKNLGTKLTKTKGGKKGLIAGALGLIFLGVAGLISKLAGKKGDEDAALDDEVAPEETDPEVAPEETDPENPVAPGGETEPEKPVEPGNDPDVVVVVPGEDGENDTVVVVPGKEDENSEAARKAKNEYTVKSGDNVWNIAKRYLRELNGRTPTNKEVLEETHRLMEVNKLKFEPDHYHVMIKPGDKIKYYENPKFTKKIEVTRSVGKGTITIVADTQEELDKKVAEAQEKSKEWEKPEDNSYKPEWQA